MASRVGILHLSQTKQMKRLSVNKNIPIIYDDRVYKYIILFSPSHRLLNNIGHIFFSYQERNY